MPFAKSRRRSSLDNFKIHITTRPAPSVNSTMELHVYRQNSQDRVIKSSSQDSTLYFILSPFRFFSTPPKQVYRGSSESDKHIATIVRDGHWRPRYIITTSPNGEDVVITHPGTFSSKSKFFFGGREFAWQADKELIDLSTGEVIARFNRSRCAIRKKGVLTVSVAGMEIVDVVVLTGIAMQYRWEATRRHKRAAANAGGG